MRTESDYATISRDLKEAIVTMMASVYPMNEGIVCDENGFKRAMAEFSRTAKWVEGLHENDMQCDTSIEDVDDIKVILSYLLPILPEDSVAQNRLGNFLASLNIPEELLTELSEGAENIPEQLNEIRVFLSHAKACTARLDAKTAVINIRIAYAGIKAIEKRERTELEEYKAHEKIKQEARRDQLKSIHEMSEMLELRLVEIAKAGKLSKDQHAIIRQCTVLNDSIQSNLGIAYELEGGEQ